MMGYEGLTQIIWIIYSRESQALWSRCHAGFTPVSCRENSRYIFGLNLSTPNVNQSTDYNSNHVEAKSIAPNVHFYNFIFLAELNMPNIAHSVGSTA